MGQLSPSHQWDVHRLDFSSLPHHGPRESVLVLGHCTGPYHFTIRPNEPGHGRGLGQGSQDGTSGTKGLSTLSHPRMRLQTNRLVKVNFCSFTYGQEYYLILVHLIHSIVASCAKDLGFEVETSEQ